MCKVIKIYTGCLIGLRKHPCDFPEFTTGMAGVKKLLTTVEKNGAKWSKVDIFIYFSILLKIEIYGHIYR